MKHTLIYNEEQDILVNSINGNFSTDDANKLGTLYDGLLDGKPYRQLIVDLSQAGKMENRDTRKVINEHLDNSKVTHVAYVGANSAVRMIARVLMKLGSLKAETTFVKDMDEAYKWIEKRRI